eukprot:XP_001691475.1 predicted protein [Chlamydomonas reinhardtii]
MAAITRPALRQLLLVSASVLLAVLAPRHTFGGKIEPWRPPLAIPCGCSDIAVRDSFLAANQSFIMQTPEDVPDGYCQISCGRCPCCPTLDSVLASKGLEMFRWLLSFSEMSERTRRPGFMATLLAPQDGAVWAAINKLGYTSKEQVAGDTGAKNILADLGRYHVLPPVQPLNATWTAPFMRRGVKMWTSVSASSAPGGGPHMITADVDTGSGTVYLSSPKAKAKVVEKDVYACKGFVQVIDTVLVPAFSAAAAELGAWWGGYFRVPMPPIGTTYTTPVTGADVMIACAGCAKNDKSKGYAAASIQLAVYRQNAATAIGYCCVRMTSGIDLTDEHLYASTAQLTNSAPGSFKPEDGTVTSIPLAPTTTTVFKPTSIFSQGLTGSCDANTGYAYLACHMVVQECVAASA